MRALAAFSLALGCLLVTGCEALRKPGIPGYRANREQQRQIQAGLLSESFRNRNHFDSDAWRDQRARLVQAIGHRDFEANFGRTFDSIVSALGILEARVDTIERTSGVVVGTGLELTPSGKTSLLHQWALENGFSPDLLGNPGHEATVREVDSSKNAYGIRLTAMDKACTVQAIKLSENRTRVKATFANLLYPPELEAYYDLLWRTIDHQLFLDRNTEGEIIRKRE